MRNMMIPKFNNIEHNFQRCVTMFYLLEEFILRKH